MNPEFQAPGWGAYPGYTPPAGGGFEALFGGDMKGPMAQFALGMAQKSMFPQQQQHQMQAPHPVQMFPQHQMQPMLMPNLYQPRPMGRLYG